MDKNWQAWIERFESGEISPEELAEFESLIKFDPAAREAFFNEMMTTVSLEANQLPDPMGGRLYKMKQLLTHRSMAIAAGLVLIAAGSFLFARYARFDAESSSDVLATVTEADSDHAPDNYRIGQLLGNGEVHLADGAEMGLAMRGGARLQLRGPIEMTIDGPDRIRLIKGRVSAYAPAYARGFTIATADGTLIDRGTRFVAAAGTGHGTEVHVLEGLVDAISDGDQDNQSLKQEHAAILRSGKVEATEFLAQRLRVPLDPILRDEDEDGFPDLVEQFYGTMANDASSSPRALRIEEDFSSQSPGPLISGPWKAESSGKSVTWSGAGNFLADGIQFEKNGKSLASSGGSFRTIGEHSVGASFHPADLELPPAGVTYVSFVMRNPEEELAGCFAGLLFYQNDREELFVGKIGTENSYGSRFRQAEIHDGFGIPMDHEPHLFVIRIDRNRLVTDVFMDPTPGSDEKDAKYQFRYQRVPKADRIEVRSGCPGRTFQSDFDEIRVGLTWKSVVPVKLD